MQLINPTKVYLFPSFVGNSFDKEELISFQKEMFLQEFSIDTECFSTESNISKDSDSFIDFRSIIIHDIAQNSYVLYDKEKIPLNNGDLFLYNTKVNIFPNKNLPQFFTTKDSIFTIFNWMNTHEIISL